MVTPFPMHKIRTLSTKRYIVPFFSYYLVEMKNIFNLVVSDITIFFSHIHKTITSPKMFLVYTVKMCPSE